MKKLSLTLALTMAAGTVLLAAPARAQEAGQQLGNVHFATSCNEVAQRRFDRAMRYQHSFWYRASGEIFEDVLKADPQCAIAYWGIALSLWNNPHFQPPQQNLAPALAAIQKAQAAGAKTQRERDFIDALASIYVDYDKTPYSARMKAYLGKMEALAARYPDDDEAQIAYAITLNISASPNDKSYAQQLKGAAILEPIALRLPQHPGVAHYLIHLYDYPAIAERGLVAAERYAKVAPAAPHAQHMPSHIFTRVGYWRQSIASNEASVQAARADKEYNDQMHGWDYMVYAHLQLGEDAKARAVIDEMIASQNWNPAVQGASFALAASPARYAIERGDWKEAAQLTVRPARFAHVQAITHFARALGAARSGDLAAAKEDIAKLVALRDKLLEAKDAYWAEQVDIQRQVASAWVLAAEGKTAEALAVMAAAADTEDKTEKAPVTPGPLAPARELYAAMLLQSGKAEDALAAYRATMEKEPNRFNGFLGAARAADKLGDKARAKDFYGKLLAVVGDAQSDRAELKAARDYVAAN